MSKEASSIKASPRLRDDLRRIAAQGHKREAAEEMFNALLIADAMIELLEAKAYQCGLEGSREWDELIAGCDLRGTHASIRAALRKAKGEA